MLLLLGGIMSGETNDIDKKMRRLTYDDILNEDHDDSSSTLLTTISSKTGGSTSNRSPLSLTNRIPFPVKLYQMLEDSERYGTESIVSWSTNGRSFRVHNPKHFVTTIMPMYFRQTRYKSFQRQLHLYGYTRLVMGSDKGGYYHPQFMRNNVDACKEILPLKKLTTKVESGPHDPKQEQTDGDMSNNGVTTSLSPPSKSDKSILSQSLPYFSPEKSRYYHLQPQHYSLQRQLDYKDRVMNLEQEDELQTSLQKTITSSSHNAVTDHAIHDRNVSAVTESSSFLSPSHHYHQQSSAAVATESPGTGAATSSGQANVHHLLSLTGYEFPNDFDFSVLEPKPFRS
jgi:hypothetical protein